MDLQSAGRILLMLGLGIALLGGLFLIIGRIFPSFGSLPGDIRIQSENVSCFAPIVSMLILSVVLTIVLNIVIRLLNR